MGTGELQTRVWRMAELLFEIWADGDSIGMHQVSEQNDRVRRSVNPNAVLVASYYATSNFEAFQKNNDWNRFGPWKPEPERSEHFFTDDEAREQREYLCRR